MDRLVECVPNFSEGRNPATIAALVSAIREVPDVYLLDQEMDHDHHRAVLTFVGAPEAVGEAAFRAAQIASRLIDLRRHQGGHPRVGATDVVPFVPIRGVTMEDCVALARQLGARIGRELEIPVFLYQHAASNPAREHLEAIRKGGPEGLSARMAEEPAWAPDFGPRALHPTAGATVVGARPPLIAYNVNLATPDLSIAKAIAKAVRFSSGGLPHVKAIGVELASRRMVQVSMNLTNFEETPIHVAFEAVRHQAEARGVAVAGSEIVGLVPRRALLQASEFFLKVERFDPTQVLEDRLDLVLTREGRAPSPASSVSPFLEAVAAGTPTPGGGSVAALAGALAAALGVMACRITITSAESTEEHTRSKAQGTDRGALTDLARRLKQHGERLQQLIEADAVAYQGVLAAYRLPKSDAGRAQAIAQSLRTATEVPLETAALATAVGALIRTVATQAKPAVRTDLEVGLLMAVAAARGALANALVNLKGLQNQEFVSSVQNRIKGIEQSLVELKGL
jgi:glutamate formiminotransferase/glutamate formiminotransferase/formiminotetrahydrofolate cyclodeaminase